jgi:hypothetical protein
MTSKFRHIDDPSQKDVEEYNLSMIELRIVGIPGSQLK